MAKEVRVASISRYGKSTDSSHYRLYVYAEAVVHCIGHVTVEDNQCVRPLYEQARSQRRKAESESDDVPHDVDGLLFGQICHYFIGRLSGQIVCLKLLV
ncbi:unnamed protein product [Brassica oleracea var. botrytis]|uniref:(rape) hypothetical protein n=1 Tax=Brassica napus TaxID=3708 RepID=A0A816UFJ4_BRANA|nr:unnamed protein product [Brassica napus]